MVALLTPAALAGCVKPEAVDELDCEGWEAFWCEDPPCPDRCDCDGCCERGCEVIDCCGSDNITPPPHPGGCPVVQRNTSRFHEPCYIPPPAPALLSPFQTRVLGPCDECRNAAIALSGGAVFVATEDGLRSPDARAFAPAPRPPELAPLVWSFSSPSLAVDTEDVVWYAALATASDPLTGGALRELVVAAWTSGDAFDRVAFVGLDVAPTLPLVERAWIASARGALVVVLASKDAGWALRSQDGGATFAAAESITPAGGAARFGAPAVDEKGRVLVPFAWTPAEPSAALTPLVAPARPTFLQYASLADAGGAWRFRGGAEMPDGIAEGARPTIALGAGVGTTSWVDGAGRVARAESWDDGGSWGAQPAWTLPAERAVGTPASARSGESLTASWWQEDGTLLVARSRGAETAREVVAGADGPPAEATLALDATGRAVVAWVDQEEVWIGEELRSSPVEAWY